jgi:LysR family hca operon transcriptional activator
MKEPLMVILPSDHRLAVHKAISPRDLAGETFVIVSDTAPVLRAVIDDKGDTPTVDLVLGYKKSNRSPILRLLLSRLDELVAHVSKKTH